MSKQAYFATCPFYLEELLKTELESFGASEFQIAHGGVNFSGSLETAYKACLWSRIANRILFPLVTFDANSPEDIKTSAENFEWENHFELLSTISIDSTLSKTKICTPDYASLSVKDGLVDRARKITGSRPSVDTNNPDIRLHLHITLNIGVISLDLSGAGLHKRGYRIDTVRAGVRENTAAAVLMRAGWSNIAEREKPLFLDPMCGAGTLITEAAMMAADIAPAINRKRFGFEKWKHHDTNLWQKLKTQATARAAKGSALLIQKAGGRPIFFGRDLDAQAITAARSNLRASAVAGLYSEGLIDLRSGDFFKDPSPQPDGGGLIAVNPPYGERLNKDDDMLRFYAHMGEIFKQEFGGWNITVLTGHKELSDALGLRADKLNTIYNGGIRCTLAHFRIFNDKPEQTEQRKKKILVEPAVAGFPAFEDLSPGAQMMYHRLKKNAKRIKKWLKNTDIDCYRLYDADMPEYSVAVDIYPPEVVIQEYAPPKTIDRVAAAHRLREAVSAVQSWLELPENLVKLKQRKKQRGSSQYEKNNGSIRFDPIASRRVIKEHGLKFYIDTTSYLDTGIFLDSRPIRDLIRREADGKSFLNLFSYTATASVYAAAGGAVSTTSVDSSKTYTDWALSNMKINNFQENHHKMVKEDCISWLKTVKEKWDLIFLDPPTFSNSKDRDEVFDLQEDHVDLIRNAISKLTEGGTLLFCNNFRKFKMSSELESELDITEITAQTLDPDFERKKSIHRCWRIKTLN